MYLAQQQLKFDDLAYDKKPKIGNTVLGFIFKKGICMTRKIIIIILPLLLIMIFAFAFVGKPKEKSQIFNLLPKNNKYVTAGEISYFKRFITPSGIQMFEFTDEESLNDTLQRLYVLKEQYSEKQINMIYNKLIAKLELYFSKKDSIALSEVMDNLYMFTSAYSELYNKETNKRKIKKYLGMMCDDILKKLEPTVENINIIYQYLYVCDIIGCNERKSKFIKEVEQLSKEEIKDDPISFKLILNCIYPLISKKINLNEMKMLKHEYIQRYQNQQIEIEEFIIYTYFAEKTNSISKGEIPTETIYYYVKNYFYVISPTIRFFAYCVLKDAEYNLKELRFLYESFPNKNGILTSSAVIIPSYRRIFAFSEICDNTGIVLNENSVKDYIEKINENSIDGQELFYAILLDNKYKKINLSDKIEKKRKELSNRYKAINKIKDTNFYECFCFLYSLSLYGQKDNSLYKKCLSYMEESNYKNEDLMRVLKAIMDSLYVGKKAKLELAQLKQRKLTKDPISIDLNFWYITYLKSNNIKLQGKECQKLKQIVDVFCIDNGSWENPTFQSVNIFRTYQCLYINEMIPN